MSAKLNVAVIGVGSLGKEHARLYADLAAAGQIVFAGIYDVAPGHAAKIAGKLGVPVFASLDDALAGAEAFSIVTPTNTHFELARRFIAAGKHVLVEKPMTNDAAQAAELVQLAREKNAILQVGHVELFNPVFAY